MQTLFWFRRDLRLTDNAALYHALKQEENVLPVFIFDTGILSQLEDKSDKRVQFIHKQLAQLKAQLQKMGSDLRIFHGDPQHIFKDITGSSEIAAVYTNHDYEPKAISRDNTVKALLEMQGIRFHTYKDQCIFEKDEVVKDDGKPYTVYTPYSKKWRAKLSDFYLSSYPSEQYYHKLAKAEAEPMLSLESIGFTGSDFIYPPSETSAGTIRHYEEKRDVPSEPGTSRLSLHFRFGTISVREKVRRALPLSDKWVNELIWRDFYMQILYHFPQVVAQSFKPEYDLIQWRNNEQEFAAWCEGRTGYPIVDAGMRELNATGFMHNRVRMIVASFLTKHLLIDWRWGEAYFAEKLLDYELASNNGGWQWAAGSGVDAAPYFRVFNPALQTEKFDPKHLYIKKWVPEYGTDAYLKPIVEHSFARERCLQVYKAALQKK